jgi:hypothetical protein
LVKRCGSPCRYASAGVISRNRARAVHGPGRVSQMNCISPPAMGGDQIGELLHGKRCEQTTVRCVTLKVSDLNAALG